MQVKVRERHTLRCFPQRSKIHRPWSVARFFVSLEEIVINLKKELEEQQRIPKKNSHVFRVN
ncbi:hypothetical protein B711_0600 [Chlamydia psittaci CP3]|nr:hypothetical protein B711_0600 [Chlamydia psittaci CP3]BEU44196.1 hypothetical protein NRM5_005090 [Chlamydia psittaci]